MLSHGELLGHYKIVSALGAGGMGEVYLAEDEKLRRRSEAFRAFVAANP